MCLQDALSEQQAEWEATVPAAVFSAQAAVQRSSVVPKLRYCWGLLDQFVHSRTFADVRALLSRRSSVVCVCDRFPSSCVCVCVCMHVPVHAVAPG